MPLFGSNFVSIEIEEMKRKCYQCNKLGHIAKDCVPHPSAPVSGSLLHSKQNGNHSGEKHEEDHQAAVTTGNKHSNNGAGRQTRDKADQEKHHQVMQLERQQFEEIRKEQEEKIKTLKDTIQQQEQNINELHENILVLRRKCDKSENYTCVQNEIIACRKQIKEENDQILSAVISEMCVVKRKQKEISEKLDVITKLMPSNKKEKQREMKKKTEKEENKNNHKGNAVIRHSYNKETFKFSAVSPATRIASEREKRNGITYMRVKNYEKSRGKRK